MINNGVSCEHTNTVLRTDTQVRSAGGAFPSVSLGSMHFMLLSHPDHMDRWLNGIPLMALTCPTHMRNGAARVVLLCNRSEKL